MIMMDMSDLLAKIDFREAIEDFEIEDDVSIGEVFNSLTPGKRRVTDRSINYGCSSTKDINAWMNWIELNPPDFWVELTHHRPKNENTSNIIVQHYLNGLARDKSFRRHISAISFGGWQPKRKDKSWHHHMAIWIEIRPNRKFIYKDALSSIRDRWSYKNKQGRFVSLGRNYSSLYIDERRGFAYGMGKHQKMKHFKACYGPRKCKGGCRHNNSP